MPERVIFRVIHHIAYALSASLLVCILLVLAAVAFGGEAFSGLSVGIAAFLTGLGSEGFKFALAIFVVLSGFLFWIVRRSDDMTDEIIRRQSLVINSQKMNLSDASRGLEEQKAAFDREITNATGIKVNLAGSEKTLQCLRNIHSLMASNKSSGALYDALLVEILRLSDSEYGFIAEFKPEEASVSFLRARLLENDKHPSSLTPDSLPQSRPYGLDDLRAGPVIKNDLEDEHDVAGFPDDHPGFYNYLSIPLRFDGRTVGVIGLANRPDGYEAGMLEQFDLVLSACSELLGFRENRKEDLLNRERLSGSEELKTGLLKAMSNNVISFDDNGIVTAINPAAEDCFLIDSDEANGMKIDDFLVLADWSIVRHAGFHQYLNIDHLALKDTRVSLSGKRQDGMVFPVELQFVPYDTDGHHFFYAVFRDLSEIREAEEALNQAHEETEWLELQTRKIKKEIAESRQAEEQNKKNIEKVERSSRTKLELLANMSNELSTPLTAIAGFSDSILKDTFGEGDSAALHEYIEYINATVAKLLDYIKETLDLSGVKDGRMGIDPRDAIAIGNYARFSAYVHHDHDLVEALFQRALETDPGNPTILSNYSLFRTSIRNDHEREDNLFKYAIEADPDSALAHGSYAVFLSDIRKHPDRAEEYYKSALRLDPDNAENLANYAKFLSSAHKYHDRAETYFKRAIECSPNNAIILGDYARFLMDIRNNENHAEIYFQSAIDASSSGLTQQLDYAMFLLFKDEIKQGIELLQEILPDLEGEDLIKALFYVFAYSRSSAERTAALGKIRGLLEGRIRNPLFDPFQDVRRLVDEGHQDSRLLEALANVITVRQDLHSLDKFPKWVVLKDVQSGEASA